MNATRPLLARLTAAVGAGFVVLCLSGCTSAPQRPMCEPTPGIADYAELPCRLAHADYAEAMNRSTPQKLLDGDRDEWIAATKTLFGAALLGVGIFGLIAGRHGSSGDERYPTAGYADTDDGPAPRPLRPLVGTHVTLRGEQFTVLDDSAPAMDPARRFGGRAAVTALDAHGRVGLLFVGFDTNGRIFEVATGAEPWAAAHIVVA